MDISSIRKEFSILSQKIYNRPLIYFDNAATTQVPRHVIDAVTQYYNESHANIHRGIHYLSEKTTAKVERIRMQVKDFIGAADSSEIIFTNGATESINIVARSIEDSFIKAGDEIIATIMDHHSNFVPWQMVCKRKNAIFKVVPIDENGNLNIDALKTMLSAKTRLLALPYVSNVLGSVNPVENIIQLAHERGVPVLIDSAQAMRHERINVQSLECDFLCFSGHKMLAGTGIGILYGKKQLLTSMQPACYGGGMINSVTEQNSTYDELPFKFEAGTRNIAGIIALGAAISYMEKIGMDAIFEQEALLMDILEQKLKNVEGISILGSPKKRSGVISFNLEDIHFFDVACLLDKLGIAVRSGHHCALPLLHNLGQSGTVRVSPAFYNTCEEIDKFIEALQFISKTIRK